MCEAVNTLLERAARTRCLSSSLGVILPFIHHWAVWPVGVLGVNALVSVHWPSIDLVSLTYQFKSPRGRVASVLPPLGGL